MTHTCSRRGAAAAAAVIALGLWLSHPANIDAQQAPPAAKAAAPVDITGNWVSLVTEDWRYRMVTPRKGDYTWLPLNAQGRQAADAWDPARDAAAGEACKAYGAPVLLRRPLRLRISWEDDNTLRIDTDFGQQTRLLRFAPSAALPAAASLQGHSVASWEVVRSAAGRGGGAAARTPSPGSLKVVTTRLQPGYLRTNGVPYSGDTVLTEWFEKHSDFDVDWLTYIQVIEDPAYLTQPYLVSSHFKREADGSKWNPSPCEIALPPG